MAWTKNTLREDLLLEIESHKSNNLFAKQLEDCAGMEKAFVWLFVELVYKFTGVSREQLKKFEEPHLIEFAQLIAERAKPRAWAAKILSVTVIGTLIMSGGFIHHPRKGSCCWNYLWLKGKIEAMRGSRYFPMAVLGNIEY